MGIFVYLRASRLPFLTGSLFPVAAATALAYLTDHTWNFLFFGLTALGVAALHLGANLINDYYDSFGSDPLNRNFTPFSGGSRVIQDGQMSPGQVKTQAYLMLGLGVGCGLSLIYLGRPWVALVGLLGLGAALFYSAGPLQLMSGGLGEIIIFLAFGPLLTLGAYYVQTGKLSLAGRRRQPAPGLSHHRHHLDQRIPRHGGGPGRGQASPGGPPGAETLPLGLCRLDAGPVCQPVCPHGNFSICPISSWRPSCRCPWP